MRNLYSGLEAGFNVKADPRFEDLVCPARYTCNPFDRWYKQKEAYSSELVEILISEFCNGDARLVDPFAGSGSTLVGGAKAGVAECYGIEINPFLHELSRTKITPVDPVKAERTINSVFRSWEDCEESPAPKLSIVEKLFGDNLTPILKIKTAISDTNDDALRRFLHVGLGCILERCSRARKDGNGIRYPKNKECGNVLTLLDEQYSMMIDDVKLIGNTSTNTAAILGDSRSPGTFDGLDCNVAIFSPPYSNCFDYTEVYKIELWMLDYVKEYADLKDIRSNSLSSHMNKKYESPASNSKLVDGILEKIPFEKTWGGKKLGLMVSHYFNDINAVLKNLKRVMGSGSVVATVIGNSAYGGKIIATDLLVASMMGDLAMDVEEIRVARGLSTSPQQSALIEDASLLRESIIIARI